MDSHLHNNLWTLHITRTPPENRNSIIWTFHNMDTSINGHFQNKDILFWTLQKTDTSLKRKPQYQQLQVSEKYGDLHNTDISVSTEFSFPFLKKPII